MRIYESYEDPLGEKVIEFKKEVIKGNELFELEKDMSMLKKLNPLLERSQPLKKSYEKFKLWSDSLKPDIDEIEDVIADYLSKSKSFIDQWESFLKKEYPEMCLLFDEERKYIYDKTFAYRLIYNLRNMDIHTHKPAFTRIKTSIESKPEILLEKEYYLNNHSGMQKSFRKELKKINNVSFNLIEIIRQCQEALIKLHEKISKEIMKELVEDGLISSTYRILMFSRKHQENNGVIGLTESGINPKKIKEKNYTQNFELKEMPYKLIYYCVLSNNKKFSFIGKIDKSKISGFPFKKDGIIYTGASENEHLGAVWKKVTDVKLNFEKDRSMYSALYMVKGLPLKYYDEKKQEFVDDANNVFNILIDESKKEFPSLKTSDDTEVLIVYFFHENAIKQKKLFKGLARQLRKQIGIEWDGFSLGDSFYLEDEKVRVFVSESNRNFKTKIKSEKYFIGSNNLSSLDIDYTKLNFQDY